MIVITEHRWMSQVTILFLDLRTKNTPRDSELSFTGVHVTLILLLSVMFFIFYKQVLLMDSSKVPL